MTLREWNAARRERRRARQLYDAHRELADAVYRLETWSFAYTPSQDDDQRAYVLALMRRVIALGGDPARSTGRVTLLKRRSTVTLLLEEARGC